MPFRIVLAALLFTLHLIGQDSETPDAGPLEAMVRRIARIGYCSSPTFSPTGDRIAFVSNISGVPQIWIEPIQGGWPAKVTSFDDPAGMVKWSPATERLAFSLAPGGGMNQQIYLVNPDGRSLRRITHGGKENNWLGEWSHDGKVLTLASNRRSGNSMDAYTYGAGGLRLRVKNPGIGWFTDISRDHLHGILYRMVNRGDSNLYLIDLANGKETLLTPHRPPGNFDGGAFSPDGRTVYFASDKDRDRIALAAVQLDKEGQPGGAEVMAFRDDADLQAFTITRDGSMAALLWNVAGKNELVWLDLTTGDSRPGPALPGEIAGAGMSFSVDGKRLVMTISGAALPPDIWLCDVARETFHQVTRSPHAGVDLAELIRPTLVRFRSHDGLELTGWLYRAPDGGGTGPVVLSFHGGPEGQDRPSFRSDYQALLAAGISVFAPNVRGSAGFGKRFVNLDNGALRWNAVKDIRACVDYLVREGVADPKRVGIMGGSYGGYMVMAGLTEYPHLFAAGANLYGVVNFQTFFEHTEDWMAEISKVEYGDPDTQGDMLRALSPIHKADRVVAPTLVLHGANDTNVPVIEAEQVVENLKRRGVPVEYILFPDEGHGFRKTANRTRSTVAIVEWFDKYLSK